MRLFNKPYLLWLTVFFVLAPFLPGAWGQNIVTVAGGGTPSPTPGTVGEGGPATQTVIAGPEDIALDSKGNLYIADGGFLLVRKVDAVTGIITTVAGTLMTNGYTGDGGPATQATFFYPSGLACDAQDNLYISDFYNNAVRMVQAPITGTVTGACTITTVVGNIAATGLGDGGPANLAGIANPEEIRFDGQGNLFIADLTNHRVRKVDGVTKIITTIAGCCPLASPTPSSNGDGGPATSARLNGPHSLAFDQVGNFYISDDFDFVIRKVTGGMINTVAGSAGVTGFTPDGGPATLASLSSELHGLAVGCGGNLFFADDFNQLLREVSPNTNILSSVAGTGAMGYSNNVPPLSAQLNHPEAILFARNSGDLYVANYASGTVQKITAYCTLTPVPTATPTPAPTAVGCGKPIETYCYPNPASGTSATILCNLCEPGQVSIRVYNTAAELVETYSFKGNGGANTQSINIGGLSHGIYYYVVQAQGSMGTYKSETSKFAVVR